MAVTPLPYSSGQTVLGHYMVAQKSGNTASIAAGGILGSIRWSQSTSFLVLLRVKVGWVVQSAISGTTTIMDVQAVIARAFTVDFTTASTAINMSTTAKTNQMRGIMNTSQMGANGPRICTTVVMSGQTATADAAPFAAYVWPSIIQISGAGTTVTNTVGMAGAMATVYEWTALGQHPVVLGNNEGVLIETVTAGPTTGTINYYIQWEWAEVVNF